MLPYLFLGIALLGLLLLLMRWYVNADPRLIARALKITAVVVGGALLVIILTAGLYRLLPFLVLTALPWWLENRMARSQAGASPGGSGNSEVETRYLRMVLDHATGEMSGTILEGVHRGQDLAQLTEAETIELLRECAVEDPDSARLLEAWLDRVYGPDWRTDASYEGTGNAGSTGGTSGGNGDMTEPEALDILGLERGAGKDEIEQAWRRQMAKNHPDAGGSTWIATRINQAKDFLLKR